jgi:hypothetical protein
MSAFQSQALDAVAFQLVAALEQYDQDTARMVSAWPELEMYRSVSEQIEKIRLYASTLPTASVQFVELLIAHAELVHFLWRAEYGSPRLRERQKIDEVRERHARCVAALRDRCVRMIKSGT